MLQRENIKTKDWIIPMLLFCIPIVSLISTIYYLISKDKMKTEWAKVAFILSVIIHVAVIYVILRLRFMSYQQVYDLITFLAGK